MRELTAAEQAIMENLTDPDVQEKAKFGWDDTFQKKLLALLLCDKFFLIQSIDKIKPEYFSNHAHVLITKLLFKYFNAQKSLPEKWILKNELSESIKDKDEPVKLFYRGELEGLYEYYVPGLDTREYLIDKITNFAKVQSLKVAFHKSLEKMAEAPEAEGTWSYIFDLIKQSMIIDRNYEPGLEYFTNIEEMFNKIKDGREGKNKFTSGFESIDNNLTGEGLFAGEIGAWLALPGTGKCQIVDTLVLMYDGTVKKVQDIQIGDMVMGNDSTPRNVLATHSLVDRVYEIRPVKGKSYYVNSKHILSLKNSHRCKIKNKIKPGRVTERSGYNFSKHSARMGSTNIYNISVEDWFNQSNHFKIKMKGWRTGVEFESKSIKIDPYILGTWLGDGHEGVAGFTNIDTNVISAIYDEAKNRSLSVRNGGTKKISYFVYSETNKTKQPGRGYSYNTLQNDLRFYNVIFNKHIPRDYKCNSREVRLQLLAGLLDSDGFLCNGGYEICQKRKVLAEDIAFIARSLGLAAYIKKCKKSCQNGFVGIYHRVYISGDCSIIPVRIPYKKAAPRRQIKDVLMTGIKVIDTEKYDAFYGFETDGNHLYLLDDFTVVHNSLNLCKAAVANVLLGHKVLYITMEMDEVSVAQRFTSQITNSNIGDIFNNKAEILSFVEDFTKDKIDPNMLIVKQFPGGQMDVNGIQAYHSQLVMRGFKPNLVIIDYVGEMKDDPNLPKYESAYRILRDLRAFGIEEQHCTLTCMQPNSSAAKLEIHEYIDESNIGTSFDQFKPLDALWSINQQVTEKEAGVGRGFIIKHRNGKSRFSFKMGFDYNTLNVFEIANERYRAAMNAVQEKKADAVNIDGVYLENKVNKKKPTKRFKADEVPENEGA